MSVLLAGTGIACFGQNPVYEEKAKTERYDVHILALSTSTRVSSNQEDVYLAELYNKQEGPRLVKLVDPHRERPIRHDLLETEPLLWMRLTRSPSCDAEPSTFFIGEAFDSQVQHKLKAFSARRLPCFQVDHSATRLGK